MEERRKRSRIYWKVVTDRQKVVQSDNLQKCVQKCPKPNICTTCKKGVLSKSLLILQTNFPEPQFIKFAKNLLQPKIAIIAKNRSARTRSTTSCHNSQQLSRASFCRKSCPVLRFAYLQSKSSTMTLSLQDLS